MGAWALVTTDPHLFAAAIFVCSAGTFPNRAETVTRLPIWAFQGAADEVVPATEYRAVIEAVRAAGGKPKYTEYPGVGHNVWLKAFAEPELLLWVFAQHR